MAKKQAEYATSSKAARKANGANLGFEEKLWQTADKLSGRLDPDEYKHVVPGLVFLKYISDAFKEHRTWLLCEAAERGEKLGLTEDELAFHDALGVNDSAVQVLGNDPLHAIAQDLVATVRRNVSIDWIVKESVHANLRRMVRRVLRNHGYPPDKAEQAVSIAKDWAG